MSNTYDTSWLDAVCDVWGTISGKEFGQVKTYHLLNKNEFPEKVTEVPCAITYPPSLDNPTYGKGTPAILYWNGLTVIHLSLDLSKLHLPMMFPYMIRIIEAVTGNPTLGGKVELFKLVEAPNAIAPMEKLLHGSEAPHYGVAVMWTVKQNVSGQFTIGS